ncbi:hypothetical protein MMC25_000090 [Agyrium rufum]|nr:hypothetical protein [Agyrium rufum]
MKVNGALLFVIAAVQVAAQGAVPVVTVTEYFSSSCVSEVGPLYSETITGTIYQTYCPECEMGESSAPAPTPGILTTYTTEFVAYCPESSALTTNTYTITEPCPAGASALPTDHVPSGFTVTTIDCPICPTPGPMAVTTPIATTSVPIPYGAPSAALNTLGGSGAPVAPGAPAAAGNGGSGAPVPTGAPATPTASGAAPSEAPATPGSPAAASISPAAAPATPAPATPAEESRIPGAEAPEATPESGASGAAGTPAASGSGIGATTPISPTITPFAGAASSIRAGAFTISLGGILFALFYVI